MHIKKSCIYQILCLFHYLSDAFSCSDAQKKTDETLPNGQYLLTNGSVSFKVNRMEKTSLNNLTKAKHNFLADSLWPGRGDTPRKVGWGCAAHFPKLLPYLWPKSAIFAVPYLWPGGGAVASWLVRASPDRAIRVRALAGDTVSCSLARHLAFTVPLSTQQYKWVPANCWGKLTNCGGMTCDGLASRPGGVETLLAASC